MAGMIVKTVRLMLTVLTGASGFYLAYYLFRWEWVRAQIAGIVFIAALIITATMIILARLDRLERAVAGRAAAPTRDTSAPPPGRGLPADPAEPRPHFPWLAELTDLSRTNVFIPALFAAGLVVSIVAGIVERVSTAMHRSREPISSPSMRRAHRSWAVSSLRALGIVALIALSVLELHEASHYDPVDLGPGTTELTVDVDVQGRPLRPAATVELMASYCTVETGTGIELERVEQVGPHTALLVVTPLLDEQMSRRFGGCLQDAVLERHWLHVTDVRLVPSPRHGPAYPPIDGEASA